MRLKKYNTYDRRLGKAIFHESNDGKVKIVAHFWRILAVEKVHSEREGGFVINFCSKVLPEITRW